MGKSLCAVEDCDKRAFGRGWCSMHYYRWLKHGDLNYERVYIRKPRAVCSVDGCTRLVTGRGWCATHYYYWRTYGTLDHTPYRQPEERFWAKVDKSGDCWEWTASRDRDGYGVFSDKGQWRAHRYSYMLEHGEIPAGMCVMHACDNPPCVNPAHLRLGTNAENAAESAARRRRPHGVGNPNAKLTEQQVLELRARYSEGGVTQTKLAAEYGVSTALVSFIVTRKAWRHL